MDFWVEKIPWRREWATHSSVLAWISKGQTWLSDFHFHYSCGSRDLEVVLLEAEIYLGDHQRIGGRRTWKIDKVN